MAEFIETYRGCDIFQELSGVFTSPCTEYARFTIERVREDIDALSEPEPDWEVHSTYRGIEIWVDTATHTLYSAEIGGVWKYGTLSTIQLLIDAFLEQDIPTTLTISAPASVEPNEGFMISGILTRNDTGGPIPSASITASYNGNIIGVATTGVGGDYVITGAIPTEGNYVLTAQFNGMSIGVSTLLPSASSMRIRTAGIAISSGLVFLGVAIGAYALLRGK